jgi:hypothetical protein
VSALIGSETVVSALQMVVSTMFLGQRDIVVGIV